SCFMYFGMIIVCLLDCFFFFFQAEDGIRDSSVTGVQTCALPILIPSVSGTTTWSRAFTRSIASYWPLQRSQYPVGSFTSRATTRSEERRVGKECRSRWAGD